MDDAMYGLDEFPIDSPGWVVTFHEDAPTARSKEVADFLQYLLRQTTIDGSQGVIAQILHGIRTGQLDSMHLIKEMVKALAEQPGGASLRPIVTRWVSLDG